MSGWRDFLDSNGPGGRYLPWKEVGYTTGLSRTTAWRLHRRDEFPKPYAISPGRVGYLESEIEAWKVWRRHLGRVTRASEAPSPAKSPKSPVAHRDASCPPAADSASGDAVLQSHRSVHAHPSRQRERADERQINFDF